MFFDRETGVKRQMAINKPCSEESLLLRLVLRLTDLLPGMEDDDLFDERVIGVTPAIHTQLTDLGLFKDDEQFVGFRGPWATARIDPRVTHGYPYVETGIRATFGELARKVIGQDSSKPTEQVMPTEVVPTLIAMMIAQADKLAGEGGGGGNVQQTESKRLRKLVGEHLQQRNLMLPEVDLNNLRALRTALGLTPVTEEMETTL